MTTPSLYETAMLNLTHDAALYRLQLAIQAWIPHAVAHAVAAGKNRWHAGDAALDPLERAVGAMMRARTNAETSNSSASHMAAAMVEAVGRAMKEEG